MFNLTSEIYTQVKSPSNNSLKLNLEDTFFKQVDQYYSYSMQLEANEEKELGLGDVSLLSGLLINADAPFDISFNTNGYSGMERNSCFLFFEESSISSIKVKAGTLPASQVNIVLVGSTQA